MIGDAVQDDTFCADTTRAVGIVVISVNYRLAPEQPFPAPLDDCYAAWQWLQGATQRLQLNKTRVAVLAQLLRDEAAVQPMAQWLFSPMLDDRTAARRKLDALQHQVWNKCCNRAGWQAYLSTAPGAERVPAYGVLARR